MSRVKIKDTIVNQKFNVSQLILFIESLVKLPVCHSYEQNSKAHLLESVKTGERWVEFQFDMPYLCRYKGMA